MDIITKSIKDGVEIQLNKEIESITIEDLKQIKNITINRLGYGEDILKIDYDEMLYFEDLEELNIFNCMINKKAMENITKLKKIKILNIYNSDFVDYIDDMFSNINIERLVISDTVGISKITLKNLKYLELRNIKDIDLLIKDVDILDISNTEMNIRKLNLANVKQVIISKRNYDDGIKYDDFNSDIIIVDNKRNIIKEIKNA